MIIPLFWVVHFAQAEVLSPAQTQVLQSEFQLQLPKGFQQRIIDKEWINLQKQVFSQQFPLPNQSLHAADTEVLLSGIQLDFQTKLQKPAVPLPGPSLVLESRDMTAHLKIQSVSVDQYIVVEVGGVTGRFHLVAQCQNLDLQLKPGEGHFRMQLSPSLQGSRISSHLDDMEIGWTENAWSLGPMTCTGAQGFESIVSQHILDLTKNSQVLTEHKAELMTLVQNYLATKSVDISTPRVISSGRPDIQYNIRITDLNGDRQNLTANGVLSVNFKNIKASSPIYLRLSKSSGVGNSSAAQLRLPEKFLQVALAKAFVPKTWQTRILSPQVPGFTDFRNSRLAECLLWPALQRFAKDAVFAFDIGSVTPLTLEGQNLNYKTSMALDVDMLAPNPAGGKPRFVPFMQFQIPLESQIQLGLTNGILSGKLTNVNVSIEPTWAPSYVSQYRPNQNFYPVELTQRLVTAAEGTSITYPLPMIQFLDVISFRVQSAKAPAGSDLVLSLY